MRPLLVVLLSAAICGVTACSSPSTDDLAGLRTSPSSEGIGSAASPIINGNLDTTHQAVVALILREGNQTGLCSGTIVKVDTDARVGWVLTAAHCVAQPVAYVLQGNDVMNTSKTLRYQVIDSKADPQYKENGDPHDFAVVRIAGVDATTPVLPLMGAPDGLASGTPVVSVGYGRTTLISSGNNTPNWTRHNVSKTLRLVLSDRIDFAMSDSGICQGDSGGPVLVSVGGGEKVVGVHSYIQGGTSPNPNQAECNGFGVSGRVSFGLDFINEQLAAPIPNEDCNLCQLKATSGNGECVAATNECLDNPDCANLNQCLAQGSSMASCVAKFPQGEGPLYVAANCTCTTTCVSTCGQSTACSGVPKCGFANPTASCATCTESACCDETLACAADGACYLCLKNKDADSRCATNKARKALAACAASKCNAECDGTGLAMDQAPKASTQDAGAAEAPGATISETTTSCGCRTASSTSLRRDATYAMAAALGVFVSWRRRRSRDREFTPLPRRAASRDGRSPKGRSSDL